MANAYRLVVLTSCPFRHWQQQRVLLLTAGHCRVAFSCRSHQNVVLMRNLTVMMASGPDDQTVLKLLIAVEAEQSSKQSRSLSNAHHNNSGSVVYRRHNSGKQHTDAASVHILTVRYNTTCEHLPVNEPAAHGTMQLTAAIGCF